MDYNNNNNNNENKNISKIELKATHDSTSSTDLPCNDITQEVMLSEPIKINELINGLNTLKENCNKEISVWVENEKINKKKQTEEVNKIEEVNKKRKQKNLESVEDENIFEADENITENENLDEDIDKILAIQEGSVQIVTTDVKKLKTDN